MNTGRTLGIAVLILGVVLLGFAYQFSEAPIDQISNALTGRYSDSMMWYVIAGIAAVVCGSFLAAFGRRIWRSDAYFLTGACEDVRHMNRRRLLELITAVGTTTLLGHSSR